MHMVVEKKEIGENNNSQCDNNALMLVINVFVKLHRYIEKLGDA